MYKLAGACYPGEVLALMGPSGSSKTSLLSVIGGRTPKSVSLEGDVLYNSAPLTKATKRSVGYVLQVGSYCLKAALCLIQVLLNMWTWQLRCCRLSKVDVSSSCSATFFCMHYTVLK